MQYRMFEDTEELDRYGVYDSETDNVYELRVFEGQDPERALAIIKKQAQLLGQTKIAVVSTCVRWIDA